MRKIINFKFLDCILVLICMFTSCSNKVEAIETFNAPSRIAMASKNAAGIAASNDIVTYELADASINANQEIIQNTDTERKLAKTGSLSFEVSSLSDTQVAIEEWVKKFDGYIVDSWMNRTEVSFTVKVPASRFDDAMSISDEFGYLLNRLVSTEDVSEQYYDLETRLSTRRILKDKLTGYLKKAKTTSELIEIEKQLADVLSEIESMEGRFRRLSGRIEYSTITITGSLPVNKIDDIKYPEFLRTLSKLKSNFVFFISTVAIGLLYVIIFGLPLIAVLAFLWWFCFGRLGLIRKLFIKLTK